MSHAHNDLADFATRCLGAVGLAAERSRNVARILVEGEMMGHDTHGLALLPSYVEELESGAMRKEGEPEVLSNGPAVSVWDGRYLPGPWLTASALDEASRKARNVGTGAVSVRRSHHLACLQAYLPAITERGQMAMVTCSDPRAASVAPFGGTEPVFTPNPMAFGIPTAGDPILIDISTSIATNAMTSRLADGGGRFLGLWALDGDGRPTDDPRAVTGERPGALLPIGGMDHGHKGYALSIVVEVLTQALCGHGRADPPGVWGASVFVQVFDPQSYAGLDAFTRQTTNLAAICRSAKPVDHSRPVRLPGEAALSRRRQALSTGIDLRPEIARRLADLGKRLGVSWTAS